MLWQKNYQVQHFISTVNAPLFKIVYKGPPPNGRLHGEGKISRMHPDHQGTQEIPPFYGQGRDTSIYLCIRCMETPLPASFICAHFNALPDLNTVWFVITMDQSRWPWVRHDPLVFL